jgi:hypothetical protein
MKGDDMRNAQVNITLTWRDENYGGVNSSAALRFYVDDDRETKQHVARQILKRHGFAINESRMAWIAGRIDEDSLLEMVSAFESKGFVVEHAGATPGVFNPVAAPSP